MIDPHETTQELFGTPRALIGMLHLGALPGAPRSAFPVEETARRAVIEARTLAEVGFHGLLIENMHDTPYLRGGVGPEITAAMAVIGSAVRRAVSLPLGVQVLAGANQEALAIAKACGGAFVRVEGFVFAHVADEGIHQSDAGALLRYRRMIDAGAVRVFADIKKKHSSHALTEDVDLVETARAAEFFGADGVIITGAETGQPASPAEVAAVREAVTIPVIVGSGIKPENLDAYASASAWIVGSSIKRDGHWSGALDRERAAALVRALRG